MAELSDRDKRMLKRQQRILEEEKQSLLREMRRQRKQLVQQRRKAESTREVPERTEMNNTGDARLKEGQSHQSEESEEFRLFGKSSDRDKDRQIEQKGASGTSRVVHSQEENRLIADSAQDSLNTKTYEGRSLTGSFSQKENIEENNLQRRIEELRTRVSDSLDRTYALQKQYPRQDDDGTRKIKGYYDSKENKNPHEAYTTKMSEGSLSLAPYLKSKESQTNVKGIHLDKADDRLMSFEPKYSLREERTSYVGSEYYCPSEEGIRPIDPHNRRYGMDQKKDAERLKYSQDELDDHDQVFISEEIDMEEKELINRLDRLAFQDRLIEEENRRRVKEEEVIQERLKLIRMRHSEMDEHKRRTQRLLDLKDREEKLEESLQRKIEEQVRHDARLSLLLREEKRLLEEADVKEKMFSQPQFGESKDKGEGEFHNRAEQDMQRNELVPLTIDTTNSIKFKELQFQETEVQRLRAARDLKKEDSLPSKSETADRENGSGLMVDSISVNEALNLKAGELDRREEYLKNLEKELQQKEDRIREKLNLKPASEPATDKPIIKGGNEPTSKQSEVTHFLRPYINTFSGADPLPKNESTFEEWKLEIDCLSKTKVYNEHPEIVNQAIRNSLKGQARKVLVTLGPEASNKAIKEKLESVFGNVASGESVLQEFYTAKQAQNESVALWGIRIEEIIQKAIEKGHIIPQQKNEMLRTKFWRALYSIDLKNATRVHFESVQNFELLRRKVRAEEYEMVTNRSAIEKENRSEMKVKTVPAPVNVDKTDNSSIKTVEVQHQPVLQDPNTKLLKDIVKRMENLENRIETMNRSRQGYRWYQNQWRNPKPSEQTNVKTAAKTSLEKKEPLNK